MKTLTVGDFKTHFSKVLKDVQQGEEFAVAFGKNKKIVAYLVHKSFHKNEKRVLGQLKGDVLFSENYKFESEEEFGIK